MRFTIDQAFARAKRILLQEGEHAPVVLVEVQEQELYVLPVQDDRGWNTHAQGRAKVLFTMGRAFAQKNYVTPALLSALFFIQEMWFVEREQGTPMPAAPSQEPDRREALCVLELSFLNTEPQQQFYQAEILRHGDIISLGPRLQTEQPKSDLLVSFLAGMVIWNEGQFTEKLKRFQEVGEL